MNSIIRRFTLNARSPAKRFVFAGIALLVVAAVAACAHEATRPPQPSKAAVCKFYSDVNNALSTANTSPEALAVLKSFEPRYPQVLAVAPAGIKPALQTMIDASRQEVAANHINDNASPALDSAGSQLETYCGSSTTTPSR